MHHLNVRVAWHDSRWDGTICRHPSANSFCIDLDRIRKERNDSAEDALRGVSFTDLELNQLPACRADSGAFLNPLEWVREFRHPYQDLLKAKSTHGTLLPTLVKVPPYSTFAVPFYWMLRTNQEKLEQSLADQLPPDEDSPFDSPWVFSRQRQEALCSAFFEQIQPKRSLVFFYTKSGHPLDEGISRLLVAIGTVESLANLMHYRSGGGPEYPMWDRLFSHSIRPGGDRGFLLPYHDYLESTGDPREDERRRALLHEIAVIPEPSHIMSFSYAGALGSPDVALSTLVRCLESIKRVRKHGIAQGPWEDREDWLNSQIAETWSDRGAFPGTGAALEALGMRLGTALTLELLSTGRVQSSESPWPAIDAIFRGSAEPPASVYAADVRAIAPIWASIGDERRALLHLLSRFSLTPKQAVRWFDPEQRRKASRSSVSDRSILENPYRIIETDLGDANDYPISMGVVDRGLLPDAKIAAAHPVPTPSLVESDLDPRRVRSALVTVLRQAGESGDSLLTEAEATTALSSLDLPHPCVVPADWLAASGSVLEPEITRFHLKGQTENAEDLACLQLRELHDREAKVRSILEKRGTIRLPSLAEDWKSILDATLAETGAALTAGDARANAASIEQSAALETITTRKLGVLCGRAGTGKTTVLGALISSKRLEKDGILFLAPTGKARVRLSQKTKANAMTIAQFLNSIGRYDGHRQRVLFDGKERYRKEKTVVIDEGSMLTLDDLHAILMALDLAHVERLILVGDPNQLPPIGVGRPFADLVAHCDESSSSPMARLTVELRTVANRPSDSLKLASWYTREQQPIDADRVLSDLELGQQLNDLTVRFWESPDDLHRVLDDEFVKRLGLSTPDDISGFNRALGLTDEGFVPFDNHDGSENFQVLSPVRMQPHGVHDLNRWMQRRFRAKQLQAAKNPWGVSLGDEEIVWGDKVILIQNRKRSGWSFSQKQLLDLYLANGEIGIAAPPPKTMKKKCLNIAFAQRSDVRFAFEPRMFGADGGPLELAYTLTVHKAQGSEFGTVFLVIPKRTRLLTREMLYTALTRSRKHLVLLLQGSDASFLYDLTRPERSETARRNSNLFTAGVRSGGEESRYAEYLVNRTRRGEMVRSKSELVIANHLFSIGLNYDYERPIEGSAAAGRLRPDFSFVTDSGDLIVWEHLGMLDRDDYRRSWDWKKSWYEKNGYREGHELFTTRDEVGGGLDSRQIEHVAEQIRRLI